MSVDISNHRSALRGAPVEIRFWAKVISMRNQLFRHNDLDRTVEV